MDAFDRGAWAIIWRVMALVMALVAVVTGSVGAFDVWQESKRAEILRHCIDAGNKPADCLVLYVNGRGK
jgi:hypothetical protein